LFFCFLFPKKISKNNSINNDEKNNEPEPKKEIKELENINEVFVNPFNNNDQNFVDDENNSISNTNNLDFDQKVENDKNIENVKFLIDKIESDSSTKIND
jgi:hypothetical protein